MSKKKKKKKHYKKRNPVVPTLFKLSQQVVRNRKKYNRKVYYSLDE